MDGSSPERGAFGHIQVIGLQQLAEELGAGHGESKQGSRWRLQGLQMSPKTERHSGQAF
jgi:hypothetical protein